MPSNFQLGSFNQCIDGRGHEGIYEVEVYYLSHFSHISFVDNGAI